MPAACRYTLITNIPSGVEAWRKERWSLPIPQGWKLGEKNVGPYPSHRDGSLAKRTLAPTHPTGMEAWRKERWSLPIPQGWKLGSTGSVRRVPAIPQGWKRLGFEPPAIRKACIPGGMTAYGPFIFAAGAAQGVAILAVHAQQQRKKGAFLPDRHLLQNSIFCIRYSLFHRHLLLHQRSFPRFHQKGPLAHEVAVAFFAEVHL